MQHSSNPGYEKKPERRGKRKKKENRERVCNVPSRTGLRSMSVTAAGNLFLRIAADVKIEMFVPRPTFVLQNLA